MAITNKILLLRNVVRALALFTFFFINTAGLGHAETTLKMVAHADLKNIDPIWTTAYITRNHGYMVYDTLFSLDENLEPQPQMVGDYSVSDDGLTYRFTLRDGLGWHDSTPVTAEDCVASLRRWGARDGMGQKLMDMTASPHKMRNTSIFANHTIITPRSLVRIYHMVLSHRYVKSH